MINNTYDVILRLFPTSAILCCNRSDLESVCRLILGHLFFFSVLGRFFSQNQCERELKKKKSKKKKKSVKPVIQA